MSVWQTIRLVAMRELSARRKGYAVVTGTLAAIGFGGMLLVATISDSGPTHVVRGSEADEVIGFFTVVILFVAIIFTGQVILEGVAEEKRSRVVEVVLGTMHPRHLLAGKIAAIGLMGLTEILIVVFTVAGAGQALDVFELPRGTTVGMVAVVFWFGLGYALYSALYAAAGAMVSPHENVANAAVPINLGLAIPYMLAVTGLQSGDTVLLRVLSIFPLTAPLTMPLRAMRGFATPWEVGLSIALSLAAAYLLVLLAGRLYSGAVMRSGKVKWREAWRMSQ